MYLQVLSRLQQRYLAQTTRYASFGPLVSVFLKLFVVFLKLTTNIQKFLNVPKRRDPNDGVTVVWVRVSSPGTLYYPQSPRQHHHHDNTTMSSPHHATTTPPKTPTGAERL